MKVIFDPTGTCRFIHNDELAEVMRKSVGRLVIRRASHVEPIPDLPGWWEADMDPVGGPKLGPFLSRREALAEEVEWLQLNDIPVPKETT